MPTTDELSEVYAKIFALSISDTTSTLIFKPRIAGDDYERQLPADLVDWAKTICDYQLRFPGQFKIRVRFDENIARQIFLEILDIRVQEENTGSP